MRGQPNPGRGGDGRRRLWSESPIARVGVRRVRALGAPPADPGPDPATFVIWAPGISAGVGEPPSDDLYMTAYPIAGDSTALNVVTVAGYGWGTVTLPSDWTLLDEGPTGDLEWFTAWKRGDGIAEDPVDFAGWDPADSAAVFTWIQVIDTDGVYTPIMGAPTTGTGATSQAMAAASSGMLAPWNQTLMLYESGSPTFPYATWTGPDALNGASVSGVSGPIVSNFFGYDGSDYQMLADLTLSTNGGGTATFVTFPIGFER